MTKYNVPNIRERVTHENDVKVTKILSTLFALLIMYLCKFGENPSTDSENNIQKQSFAKADGICTKIIAPPPPFGWGYNFG